MKTEHKFDSSCNSFFNITLKPARWRRGSAISLHSEVQGSIPGRDRPKSLKQVVTSPVPNAGQQVWESLVLVDGHHKPKTCVTVVVACLRTRCTAHRPWVPSIGQNWQPFSGYVDVLKWVKNVRVGRKTLNKQTQYWM